MKELHVWISSIGFCNISHILLLLIQIQLAYFKSVHLFLSLLWLLDLILDIDVSSVPSWYCNFNCVRSKCSIFNYDSIIVPTLIFLTVQELPCRQTDRQTAENKHRRNAGGHLCVYICMCMQLVPTGMACRASARWHAACRRRPICPAWRVRVSVPVWLQHHQSSTTQVRWSNTTAYIYKPLFVNKWQQMTRQETEYTERTVTCKKRTQN